MYAYILQNTDYVSPALPYAAVQRQRMRMGASPRSWFQAALRRWKQRRMIAAFEAMDDKLLLDIGIRRNQIHEVVAQLDDRELNMTPVAPPTDHLRADDDRFSLAA